jgi:hypothetical protein
LVTIAIGADKHPRAESLLAPLGRKLKPAPELLSEESPEKRIVEERRGIGWLLCAGDDFARRGNVDHCRLDIFGY